MKPKTVLIGICGGIAAYKALDVVKGLAGQGHHVRVIMTEAARHFMEPAAFEAASGAPVLTSLWQEGEGEAQFPHLYPSTRADLCIILPATANTLAKITHGLGDDLLSTACLSLPASCEKVFCPAMNVEMWRNTAVQTNVRVLESRGWLRLGPEDGPLACGMTGPGRLREPADILEDLAPLLSGDKPLAGKTILILSGPTHEYLDPVRFIGNASSGLMGKALAEAARRRGATVKFVTGPIPEAHLPNGVDLHKTVSANDMLATARENLPECDAVIFAAAVADYRPSEYSGQKRGKSDMPPEIALSPNPDIAATLCENRTHPFYAIGFALQSHDGEMFARKKLEAKHLDAIILNAPDSMGADNGDFSCLTRSSAAFDPWGRIPKRAAAEKILDLIPTGS
jgi:phosphopantothenoylcysteine decarboxylase/phosphopantothenate--cysteine ligase